MSFITKILFASVALPFIALISISLSDSKLKHSKEFPNEPSQFLTLAPAVQKDEPHLQRFINPALAYKILNTLDIFEPVKDSYFNGNNSYHKPFMGLRNDDNYCQKHRSYITEYPQSIFHDMNFIVSEPHGSIVRSKVVQSLGHDLSPNVGIHMPLHEKQAFIYDIKPYGNIFFTKTAMNEYKHLGQHFSCLTQISNHIPGQKKLTTKDLLSKSIVEYGRQYDNRAHCFASDRFFSAQDNIEALLLDGHDFKLKTYMLVASSNPLIAYYHDGFLKVDQTSSDTHFDEETVRLAQQWSFERLQEYLLENLAISSSDWLDGYLRPELKKAMVHLLRISSNDFIQRSSVYGLYEVEFVLNTNMNLWFVGANSGATFKGYSEPMEEFIVKMLQDHFEIVFGLLRSRTQRVINYVNHLIGQGEIKDGEEGQLVMRDIEGKRNWFREITRNYFEEEFEPMTGNGFEKIIDANKEGVTMYQGIIEEECL